MSDATRAVETPNELINELVRRVRDLEAKTLPKAFSAGTNRPEVVQARVTDATSNTISTTETAEETVTLAIPTNWVSYNIEVIGKADVFVSGTLTGVRTVTLRLRKTNASGTVLLGGTSIYHLQIAAPNRSAQPMVGTLTGETATGNVPIVFTTEIPADTGQASTANRIFLAKAWRTA